MPQTTTTSESAPVGPALYTTEADGRTKLKAKEVQYLCLEGGGGAGNAFFGALLALEQDLKILRTDPETKLQVGVKGFAGASAGAITSMVLSMGRTAMDVGAIGMAKEPRGVNFDSFFEEIFGGLVPRVGTYAWQVVAGDHMHDKFTRYLQSDDKDLMLFLYIISRIPMPGTSLPLMLYGGAKATAKTVYDLALNYVGEKSSSLIRQRLDEAFRSGDLLASLADDGGIFPGQAIRMFLSDQIRRAVNDVIDACVAKYLSLDKINPYPAKTPRDKAKYASLGQRIRYFDELIRTVGGRDRLGEITFEQHYEVFGTDLVIAGTNVDTLKTEYFSRDTSPQFLVADAVRISMSLPVIFKPVPIYDNDDLQLVGFNANSWVKGTWVDGGVLNNCPIDAFDQKAKNWHSTLGLRLRQDERVDLQSTGAYYKRLKDFAIASGESHMSRTTSLINRAIELPVKKDDMDLLDFKPKTPKIFHDVNKDSYQAVCDYFGRNPAGYETLYGKFTEQL